MCDDQLDAGFSYHVLKNGSIQVLRHGRVAMVVGGKDAAKLQSKLERAEGEALQLLLARASGQYKFGNEKVAKNKRGG